MLFKCLLTQKAKLLAYPFLKSSKMSEYANFHYKSSLVSTVYESYRFLCKGGQNKTYQKGHKKNLQCKSRGDGEDFTLPKLRQS